MVASPSAARRVLRSLLIPVALVGALLSCNQDETPFGPQDLKAFESGVHGRVTDRAGRALSGALVTALPGGMTTVSGPDGSFTLTGLSTGKYRIAVVRDDYRDTVWLDSVRLGLAKALDIGSQAMRYRFAAVRGIVVDAQGVAMEPTAAAAIAVEDQMVSAPMVSQGKFFLGKVEPGRVRLFASVAGLGYATLDTLLQPEDTLSGLRLKIDRKGGVLVGQVVDADGNPVAGAVVTLLGGALRTSTDADGDFRLAEVPGTGRLIVTIQKDDLSGLVSGVTVGDGKITDLSRIPLGSLPAEGPAAVRSGVAIAYEGDSAVRLAADLVVRDTSFRVLRYLWSPDPGVKWDTTSGSLRALDLRVLGWTGGTHKVKVKAMAVDGRTSGIGTIEVRILPPPDRSAPTVRREAPLEDTTRVAFAESTAIVAWKVSDDRRLGIVRIGGQEVAVDQGRASREIALPVGTTTVPLVALDSAGNESRDSVVLVRAPAPPPPPDTAGPVVVRPSGARDTLSFSSAESTATVGWTVSALRGLAGVWIGGEPVEVFDGQAVRTVPLPVGTTKVVLLARDSAGREARDSVFLVRPREVPPDEVPPTFRRLDSLPDTVVVSPLDTAATVSWTVSDNRALAGAWIDGDSVGVAGGEVSRTVALRPGDTLVVRLLLRDSSSNETRDSVVLVRPPMPPPAAKDSTLGALRVGAGFLQPGFLPARRLYLDTVAATDSVLTVVALPLDTSARTVIHGIGADSVAVPLGLPGTLTRIEIVVRASDGDTLHYAIDVFRPIDSTFGVPWKASATFGELLDARDGRTYRTVSVNGRAWMAQNLAYGGPDGTTGVCPTAAGGTASGDSLACAKYGRWYSWSRLVDGWTPSAASRGAPRGLCPAGWHVPDVMEWDLLQMSVGGPMVAGRALKSVAGWPRSGTDSLGFRALPAGYRLDGGSFLDDGYAAWWTSTRTDTANVLFRTILPDDSGLFSDKYSPGQELSARCVEDRPDLQPPTYSLDDGNLRDSLFPWTADSAVVSWTVSDDHRLDSVYLQGVPATSFADGKVAIRLALADTAVPVELVLLDSAGHRVRDTLSLVRQAAPLDSSLHGLAVDTGVLVPSFDPARKTFVDTVAWGRSTLRLTLGADSAASITARAPGFDTSAKGNLIANLPLGEQGSSTSISVKVVAPDGDSTVYVLEVWRQLDSTFGIAWTPTPQAGYGSLYDIRDQRTYRTVVVGGMRWMAENLAWAGAGTCPGSGASAGSGRDCLKYGRLYSWTELVDGVPATGATTGPVRGLCPAGWHVPTDAEWGSLVRTFDGGAFAANVLKASAGWPAAGTDAYGWRGLPAGRRLSGTFFGRDTLGSFWSATVPQTDAASGWQLDGSLAQTIRDQSDGLSARCVEDFRDTVPPVVLRSTPSTSPATLPANTTTTELYWEVTDAVAMGGVVLHYGSMQGPTSDLQPMDGPYYVIDVPVADTVTTYILEATDSAGNHTYDTVKVSRLPPTLGSLYLMGGSMLGSMFQSNVHDYRDTLRVQAPGQFQFMASASDTADSVLVTIADSTTRVKPFAQVGLDLAPGDSVAILVVVKARCGDTASYRVTIHALLQIALGEPPSVPTVPVLLALRKEAPLLDDSGPG